MKNAWNRMGWVTAGVLALLVVAAITGIVAGGPLDPPGPPGSTQPQVEPRTPISSLPYTITQPGSYYLTKNLTASGTSDGITIQSNDVAIDLNGFTIRGFGGANAITEGVGSPSRYRWNIHSGVIETWGSGIYAPSVSDSHFSDLIVNGTAYFGIRAGGAIMANHITVHGTYGAGAYGLSLGPVAQLSDCFVDGDALVWLIAVGEQSTVTRCSTVFGAVGVVLGASSKADACTVRFAANQGMWVTNGASVTDSTIAGTGPGGWGLYLFDSTLVANNLIDTVGSGGVGIAVGGTANRMLNNQIEHMPVGIAFYSTGNTAYQNAMRNIPTPITGAGGNEVPALVGPGSAANPWANLAY